MANAQINPKFAGLANSIAKSEVLTSKYRSAIHAAGEGQDEEGILGYMEELSSLLKMKGLVCHDERLESFGSAIYHLVSSGHEKVASGLVEAILSFGISINATAIVPATLIETLSKVTDKLAAQTYEMKDISRVLKEASCRKVIKAAKKKSKKDSKSESLSQKDNAEDQVMDTTGHDTEHKDDAMAEEESHEVVDPSDLNSSVNVTNRGILRKHYSCEEFDMLDETVRKKMLDFYISEVLHVNNEIGQSPNIKYMLYDVIDKSTLITILRAGKSNTLKEDDILLAIEEVVDAINGSEGCYGPFSGKIGKSGSTPILIVTQTIPSSG